MKWVCGYFKDHVTLEDQCEKIHIIFFQLKEIKCKRQPKTQNSMSIRKSLHEHAHTYVHQRHKYISHSTIVMIA